MPGTFFGYSIDFEGGYVQTLSNGWKWFLLVGLSFPEMNWIVEVSEEAKKSRGYLS